MLFLSILLGVKTKEKTERDEYKEWNQYEVGIGWIKQAMDCGNDNYVCNQKMLLAKYF